MTSPNKLAFPSRYAVLQRRSQETIEQFSAVAVEFVEVADEELDAMAVGDQQAGARQAPLN